MSLTDLSFEFDKSETLTVPILAHSHPNILYFPVLEGIVRLGVAEKELFVRV